MSKSTCGNGPSLDLSEIQGSSNNQAESPQKLKIQESKALKYRARCACKLKQELLIYSNKSLEIGQLGAVIFNGGQRGWKKMRERAIRALESTF